MTDWKPIDLEPQPRIDHVVRAGTPIRTGDRVRLKPLGRADVMDIALEGRIATVVSFEQDFEDRTYVAVTIDDDPGNDFGRDGQIGHRFFFGVEEVEPLSQQESHE